MGIRRRRGQLSCGALARARLPTREYVLNAFVSRVPLVGLRMRLYRLCGVRLAAPTRTTILTSTDVCAPRGIAIGAGTVIGRRCLLDGRGGLTIGENVNISGYSILISGAHEVDDADFGGWVAPTVVGDRAWIGVRAVILGGISIGEGAVVAAGAVVTRDVEPFKVVAGVPARVIKERRQDLSYALDYRPDWV